MSKVYGYIRNDYPEPIIEQIKQAMLYNCESLIIEESESSSEKLYKLLTSIGQQDCLVVYNMSVFDKTILEFNFVLTQLASQNIRLISIKDDLDTDQDTNFFRTCQILNEMEAHIQKRRELFEPNNPKKLGRPRIPEELVSQIHFLYFKKRMTFREIAQTCDLSLGTVHKYITETKKDNLRLSKMELENYNAGIEAVKN